MNSPRFLLRSLLAVACLAFAAAPALHAADAVLPLKASFEKVTGSEGAPYVLHLTNDSKVALKVSGKVLLSVVHHAMDKARVLPEQTVEPGKMMMVKDLSAQDKVILTAPGYAPLELVVH